VGAARFVTDAVHQIAPYWLWAWYALFHRKKTSEIYCAMRITDMCLFMKKFKEESACKIKLTSTRSYECKEVQKKYVRIVLKTFLTKIRPQYLVSFWGGGGREGGYFRFVFVCISEHRNDSCLGAQTKDICWSVSRLELKPGTWRTRVTSQLVP
jgi:hypothetical protein